MTENKRFKLAFEDFDGWAILDTTGEYSDDEDYIDWLSGQKAVDVLNHFAEENEQLKQEVTHWKKILDNHQQIVAKTLREQYHWLKNEDKIQNNDKTVALLELESISERLGIDLN